MTEDNKVAEYTGKLNNAERIPQGHVDHRESDNGTTVSINPKATYTTPKSF